MTVTWEDRTLKQVMRLAITAGHSSKDPGAVANGHTEAEIVTDFRNRVAERLRDAGVTVVTDGDDGENFPLSGAIKIAEQADVAVEFHLNAAHVAHASGVETLSSREDFALGKKLCGAIHDVLRITNRGAKPEGAGQHARLGFVQAGGIIVELFFLTNPTDLERYKAHLDELVTAVAGVLCDSVCA